MATLEAKLFIQENGEKRELTGQEKADHLAQLELDNAAHAEQLTAEAAVKAQKAALLDRLGITAEEARLLLA
jgi:hypothetical protein